ncbi:MAG: formylglycine-generating enzyme family protein [bacterium]|nr:formylglycine-generating enzyme family protein [bacterium]
MNRKKLSLLVLILMTAFTVSAQNSKDVNGDGVVNVTDVVDVINHILTSSENPNPSANQNSKDVNGDGVVNVTDVVDVINYILKPSEDPNPSANRTFTVNGVSFEMIAVEGGTFTMGATAEQGSDAESNESPTHQVTLSSYMIGKTEVTQELWQAVMGSNPSSYSNSNLPVETVSWEDCQIFITKLNGLTGKKFRLPTEAEWEYAARGGNKSQGYKYSGSNTIDDVAWYRSNSSSGPHLVATKAPNELGIYDMSGNVWEWCSDRYGDYSSSEQTNPTGPASGSKRVRRGGSYNSTGGCRVSFRTGATSVYNYSDLGLRLCLGTTETFTVNGVSFDMIDVEGGTFTMGATDEQGSDAESNESPTHQVTLSSYMIGKTEVTQELWQAVMGSNPSYYSGTNLPVENVSWNDCQTFITKLNILTGKNFRLPTEAEWEYAARGGNKSQGYKYSGSNTIIDVAWYTSIRKSKTHPVATKAPNELGIYDMSGNVWEWCSDWYGDYSSSSQSNPIGPASGSDRVLRGGGWDSSARCCRVSYRYDNSPGNAGSSTGLRLCLGTTETFTVNGVSFDMVRVEGGTFTMGATEEQGNDADSDESPTHQVTLSSYMIGKTEVTRELWQVVMGSKPNHFIGANLPVETVSWNDCQEFITKLNELTGKKFRLPTEAEWEYAARGGNKSQGYKYSGSITLDDVAWYSSNSSSKTHPVATKAPNELGIYDMSGNVWEWCSDRYGDYSSSAQTNPTGPASGANRVLRGGGWSDDARYCRVSFRSSLSPDGSYSYMGFRLCLSE